MLSRLSPYLLLALLALLFFGDVVLYPTQVLYSDHSDLLAMHLPMKRFLVRSWHETGELPLWFPYSFAGTPFVHDVQVAMFYPPHWLLLPLPEEQIGAAITWLIVLHVMIAGWCAFALARKQGLGIVASLVAAIGFMFAGKWLLHILAAGHTIMAPLAWLPLALLLLEGAVQRRSVLRATLAGAVFALIVLGTHPQITFYAGLFLAAWCLQPALEQGGYLGPRRKSRSLRPLLGWALLGAWAALVAVALSAVQLLPALEAAPETTRGVGVAAEATQTVSALRLVLSLIGPGLLRPNWEYQGGFAVLWVAAAAVAPFLRSGRARFLVAVTILLVLFSLGVGILVQGLPGFNLFQLPVRMLLIVALPVALLAGHTTRALLDLPDAMPRRRIVRIVAVVLASCGLLIVGALLVSLLAGERPPIHLYWLLLPLTLPAFLWLLSVRAATTPRWAVLWIAILTADLWALARPALAVRSEADIYPLSHCVQELVDRRIEDRDSPWRVLDRGVPNNPSSAPLGVSLPPLGNVTLEPVLGYNTFDVRRTRQYLAFAAGSDEPVKPKESKFGYSILEPMLIENKTLFDLLGVRYLLNSTAPADRPLLLRDHDGKGEPGRYPGWKEIGTDPSPKVYSFEKGGVVPLAPHAIYENMEVFPRAFVVNRAEPLPPRERVLSALRTTDLRGTVFLEDWHGTTTVPVVPLRAAKSVDERPNRVVVHLDPGPAGYLVLTDVWYPGWRCSVDGQSTKLYRADYLFRAVDVPAGAREVVFTFEPASYQRGRMISLVALGVVLVLVTGVAVSRRFARVCNPPLNG
jgi:hypothetical protein